MNTRSGMRRNKNNKNFILNSLIGVVFILILAVVGNMIFNDSDATTEDQQNTGGSNGQDNDVEITEGENADQNSESVNSDQESNNEQDESESQQDTSDNSEQQGQEENESQQDTNDNNEQQDKEENESQQEEQDGNGVNSDQIGEPIGTSQTGQHTSSYDKGSVDWNEKVKAIQMATGLNDSMTIWHLGNGGGPQKSVGEVSPEGVQDWMYVVNLEWVDEKGWKVTNVNKQNR